MSYSDYLRQMLEPIGVYDLTATSFSGAEVEAMGTGLEGFWQDVQVERLESIISTATDNGLTMWEQVFPYRAPVETVEERRAALCGFLTISGDSFTYEDICVCLAACGVTCTLEETDTPGVVDISFDGLVGEPDNYETVQAICETILPSHVLINYNIVYLTWGQALEITWGDVCEGTWHDFERYVV
ncbi:MAG: hypothetical protein R3Y62_00890 [Eubacteriales bacterium]